MKTDYLDVLFFHSPFSEEEIRDDGWGALEDLKASGKVRFIGHSISKFEATESLARKWARDQKIDVIQVVYSLMNREASSLIRDLGAEGVGVVARDSLANGFLSGQVRRDTVFPKNNLNSRYSEKEIEERVDCVEHLAFLVRPPAESMPQAAYRWVLDNPSVSMVLSGAKTAEELLETSAVSEIASFTPEELRRAEEFHHRDFPAA